MLLLNFVGSVFFCGPLLSLFAVMIHFFSEFEVLGAQRTDIRHKENTRASLLVYFTLVFSTGCCMIRKYTRPAH